LLVGLNIKMGDFDLESLVHLEQTFYDVGHEDGFAH